MARTEHDHIVANLLAAYYAATPRQRREGRSWYPMAARAARAIARETHVPRRTAAGTIAALSPRNRWGVNVRQAHVACATQGEDVRHTTVQAAKVRAMIAGASPLDALTGPKERAFYRAIAGHTNAVTVDVWFTRAALGRDTLTTAEYDDVVAATYEAARIANETPRAFQAIVWVVTRGSAS